MAGERDETRGCQVGEGLLRALGSLVDGELAAEGEPVTLVDPKSGTPAGSVPSGGAGLVGRAVEAAARAARTAWAADEDRRRAVMTAMVDAMAERRSDIEPLLCLEKGTRDGGPEPEFDAAVAFGRYLAAAPLRTDVLEDGPTHRVLSVPRPVGVVGVILPWNAPLLGVVEKALTALLAGNSVVVKPSPFTPSSALALGRVWRDIVPPGVVNIVVGGDDAGAALVGHPATGMVSFTGSVANGRRIAAAAGPRLANLLLELGGNDPAIVLPGNDPAEIAPRLFGAAFIGSGQICTAIKRLYVHDSLFDAVVDELARLAAKMVPTADGGTWRPLITRPQFERIGALVDDAVAHGARVAAGGAPLDRPGFYYAPTIVTGVAAGVRLVDEEQFGPALPVMPFSTTDEAVAAANASEYGLGASVWTPDEEQGLAVAARLECGTAWVNDHARVAPHVPFGGVKASGVGRVWGQPGIEAYCERQSVVVRKGARGG